MRYIVIRKASKRKCPEGIKGIWDLYKVPSELWVEWERKEIPEDLTPDIYTDHMEDTIENYSRNFPECFWEWHTETIKSEDEEPQEPQLVEDPTDPKERELPF